MKQTPGPRVRPCALLLHRFVFPAQLGRVGFPYQGIATPLYGLILNLVADPHALDSHSSFPLDCTPSRRPLLSSSIALHSLILFFLIMVDWKDPAVVAKCASLFANLSHVTAGAYTVEVLRTSVYDYEIVTRKRPWKWTMPASTCSLRYCTILLNPGLE